MMLEGAQIKPTAREFSRNYKTLGRYVEIKERDGQLENASYGYAPTRKIF